MANAARPRQRTVPQDGEKICDLREAAGLTQAELAKLVGCSAPYISQLERGTRVKRMSRRLHARLSRVLNVEPQQITLRPGRAREEEAEPAA